MSRGRLRHFTATAFVVDRDRVLLHWHRKVRAWLPPGGHINPGEDPVEAALRETREEAGIRAEVIPTRPPLPLSYPAQVAPPFTILIEDIDDPRDGPHQHIDLIYFCRPVGPPGPASDGWLWVSAADLAAARPIEAPGGGAVSPPEDVRLLAAEALRAAGDAS